MFLIDIFNSYLFKIPVSVDDIKENGFFVRVGLSDTYRRERIVRGRVKIKNKTCK